MLIYLHKQVWEERAMLLIYAFIVYIIHKNIYLYIHTHIHTQKETPMFERVWASRIEHLK